MEPLLVAYLSFTLILVLTPGAATAVVVRHTLGGGWRTGVTAAAGAAVGNTTYALATGFGATIALARFPAALTSLRIAGAAYLGWLGARSLWRAAAPKDGSAGVAVDTDATQRVGAFRDGFLANLLNPPVALFYLVIVPSFLPAGATPRDYAGLAAAHILMAFSYHAAWTFALDRLRRVFRTPTPRRVLEALTGAALVWLAIRLIT